MATQATAYKRPGGQSRRLTAEIEGDFVIFLIGMRINRWWKIHRWLPVAMSMGPMLQELSANPESGFLGALSRFGLRDIWLVQYWRSHEHLIAYAQSRDHQHFPAWRAFNQRVGVSGEVGVWHETYRVRASEYEAIYVNMPPFGLGTVGNLAPASGKRHTARGRLGLSDGADAPIGDDGEVIKGRPPEFA